MLPYILKWFPQTNIIHKTEMNGFLLYSNGSKYIRFTQLFVWFLTYLRFYHDFYRRQFLLIFWIVNPISFRIIIYQLILFETAHIHTISHVIVYILTLFLKYFLPVCFDFLSSVTPVDFTAIWSLAFILCVFMVIDSFHFWKYSIGISSIVNSEIAIYVFFVFVGHERTENKTKCTCLAEVPETKP